MIAALDHGDRHRRMGPGAARAGTGGRHRLLAKVGGRGLDRAARPGLAPTFLERRGWLPNVSSIVDPAAQPLP